MNSDTKYYYAYYNDKLIRLESNEAVIKFFKDKFLEFLDTAKEAIENLDLETIDSDNFCSDFVYDVRNFLEIIIKGEFVGIRNGPFRENVYSLSILDKTDKAIITDFDLEELRLHR